MSVTKLISVVAVASRVEDEVLEDAGPEGMPSAGGSMSAEDNFCTLK